MKIFDQEAGPFDLFLILVLLLAASGAFIPSEGEEKTILGRLKKFLRKPAREIKTMPLAP